MTRGQDFKFGRGHTIGADRLENKDRSRWYGVRPGDIVSYSIGGAQESGLRVVRLHPMDNNGCTVRRKNGQEFKCACEWLNIEKRVDE